MRRPWHQGHFVRRPAPAMVAVQRAVSAKDPDMKNIDELKSTGLKATLPRLKIQLRWAKDQASSAMGRAVSPEALAWALEAVPASTRLAMPCRMAAMRNML